MRGARTQNSFDRVVYEAPSQLEDWTLPSTAELFGRIRKGYGFHLEAYRAEALRPLLQRRMHALRVGTLGEYMELTVRDQGEFDQLIDSLLPGSTSFFRDPLSFAAVRDYLARAEDPWGTPGEVRAWVAGCSTGEEAYSVAMLLLDVLAVRGERRNVRVFATDLRPRPLQVARRGVYPASALGALAPAQLEELFVRDPSGYRVSKRLRDAVVFGQHDLLVHPPFAKLDLLSCRNVMLYLHEHAQRYLLTRFHFGLRPGGVLFLGPAESPASKPGYFRARNREHRLYGKIAPTEGP